MKHVQYIMRRLGALLLLAAGCATSPARVQARTELTLLEPQPTLGQRIRLQVTLSNDGASAFHFWAFGGYDVLGPDGTDVPYILGPRQTASSLSHLRPGETVTIDELWLNSSYLIDRPGRYSVRFAGRLSLSETEPGFDTPSVPAPSNTIRFDVAGGEVSEGTWMARRLLEILPPGWDLGMDYGTYENEDQRIALIKIRTGQKVDTLYITLVVAKQPPGPKRLSLESNEACDEAWPGHAARILKALEPRFRK